MPEQPPFCRIGGFPSECIDYDTPYISKHRRLFSFVPFSLLFALATGAMAFPVKVDIAEQGQQVKAGWQEFTAGHQVGAETRSFDVGGIDARAVLNGFELGQEDVTDSDGDGTADCDDNCPSEDNASSRRNMAVSCRHTLTDRVHSNA